MIKLQSFYVGSETILAHENVDSLVALFLDNGFVETSNFVDEHCFGNRMVSLERDTAKARVIDDRGSCFVQVYHANEWQYIEKIVGVELGTILISEVVRKFLKDNAESE